LSLKTKNVEQLSEFLADVLRSDREAIICVDGFKGEGKSVLMAKLAVATAKIVRTPFSFSGNMTWLRDELRQWIDPGEQQKPEMSCLIADEIVSMFFGREWFDSDQVDAVKLLNMCRDRHLLLLGAVPNFWELDKAFRTQVRYWIHVERRGIGWMFMQSKNAGAKDKWCQREIEKLWDKTGSAVKARNFVCRVVWDDWTESQRDKYLKIRNTKRLGVENQRKKPERVRQVLAQRDILVRALKEQTKISETRIAEMINVDQSRIHRIINNPHATMRV